MNSTTTTNGESRIEIKAQVVAEEGRLETLPRHFGRYLVQVEDMVYQFARRLVPAYTGGFWHFYELSNGGFYMAPDVSRMHVYVDGNGFDGEMSADAIGITVCLFTFSHGSFRFSDDPKETFARHYQLLRDFSYFHPEGRFISAAID
jgi:hypothetical protein